MIGVGNIKLRKIKRKFEKKTYKYAKVRHFPKFRSHQWGKRRNVQCSWREIKMKSLDSRKIIIVVELGYVTLFNCLSVCLYVCSFIYSDATNKAWLRFGSFWTLLARLPSP